MIVKKLSIYLHHAIAIVKKMLTGLKASKVQLGEGDLFATALGKIVPMLAAQGPATALAYLLRKYRFSRFASIRFLKILYRYAMDLEKQDLCRTSESTPQVIIHFCCWGERYAEKVIYYVLPSLLSANNLPRLAQQHRIVLLIHCDLLTQRKIINSDNYQFLAQQVTVQFCLLPSQLVECYEACIKGQVSISVFPTIRYLLLGVCQTHAFKMALQQQAYISFLMPDVVLSESFMSYAFERIRNKKIVLTTTYRTNHRGALSDLKKYYMEDQRGCILTISAPALAQLQIKHMHPNEQKRIVSTATENFSPMARLVFKNEKGFTLRCFHYHPVIINCVAATQEIPLDYLPIDNTALNNIMDPSVSYADQAWVCDNASEMAIMELSDENPEADVVINTKLLEYPELLAQVKKLIAASPQTYDTAFNRFLVSYRHRFIAEETILHPASEIIDDAAFFSDLYQSLPT